MTDSHDGRCMPFGTPRGFKSRQAQDRGNATRSKSTPEEALAGGLGAQEDDCSESYSTQYLNVSDSSGIEASPSAGWRAVYAAMGVDAR